ncbi:MAG: GTPase HflX [Paracoccaceae bacterium]|nr:GTPase HflX [Paracoccaceae bacterium]
MRATEKSDTRAWVLLPDIKSDPDRREPLSAMGEAVSLAMALPGLEAVGSTIVPLPKPNPGHLFGKGKLEELKQLFHDQDIELVIIDGLVSPVQQRNLEKLWKVKLLDRTSLILEIFSDRAATREGVLQVEMAALSYQRTRLVRAWTHLERQRGGLGFVGGPGETQIEADRRAIDQHLVRLRRQLSKVVKTRSLHRAARAKVPFPVVALVGYTNAGKSTLFNRLTGAGVMAKDMLFATLDPTMRSVKLGPGFEVIFSDTVGFISDLPTELVAAFRATLEEVLTADIILHVRDISHAASEEQAGDVDQIIANLGVSEATPIFQLWNKIDLLPEEDVAATAARADRQDDVFAISALSGDGIEQVLDTIATALNAAAQSDEIVLDHADGKRRAWLYAQGVVIEEQTRDTDSVLSLSWTSKQKTQFAAL